MDPVKNRAAGSGLTIVRADVLDKIRNQPDPVGVTALAALTGRHPNTLREHLTWLVDQGLVVRHRALTEGRGRPAWLYEAVGPRPADTDHAEVAAALAWSLGRQGESVLENAMTAGRRRGRELCREHGTPRQRSKRAAREQVVAVMDAIGFAPEADETVSRLRLTRCPLLQAAHTNETIVCGLHEGLVKGVLEECGAPFEDVHLTPFAEPGACLLVLSAG